MIAPLPLYHIYAFTANCMCMMVTGNHNVLITNPRDIGGFIKELKKVAVSGLLGLNTLFVALMDHPDFKPWISPASSSPTPAAPRWSRPPPSAGSRSPVAASSKATA
jgi:acyl-CoA synthetase (AMP-forming)/AMP-acid ligase II